MFCYRLNKEAFMKLILTLILVSFSLNGLEKCIRATHEYQQFNKNIEEEMKVKGPVLRREDFDATKFRTVSANFQELHPGRLVKERFVQIVSLVTNPTFRRRIS